jgi:hypothetical protein
VPVTLDSGQQRFAARLEHTCSSKLKELHSNPSISALICRVVRKYHEHSRTTEGMNWPAPGEEAAVRTTILDNTAAAKSAVQRWAAEKEAKIGAGVWLLWTVGSCSGDGHVGAAADCQRGNERRSPRILLGTGHMEVFDTELWAIGLALDVAIEKRDTLQMHRVKTLAIVSDSQNGIQRAAQLVPGQAHLMARRFNRREQSILAYSILTDIHCVPGYSGIPGNEEADCQANLARDASGRTVIEQP